MRWLTTVLRNVVVVNVRLASFMNGNQRSKQAISVGNNDQPRTNRSFIKKVEPLDHTSNLQVEMSIFVFHKVSPNVGQWRQNLRKEEKPIISYPAGCRYTMFLCKVTKMRNTTVTITKQGGWLSFCTQSDPVGDEDERVQIFSPRRAWTITWTVCRYKQDTSTQNTLSWPSICKHNGLILSWSFLKRWSVFLVLV